MAPNRGQWKTQPLARRKKGEIASEASIDTGAEAESEVLEAPNVTYSALPSIVVADGTQSHAGPEAPSPPFGEGPDSVECRCRELQEILASLKGQVGEGQQRKALKREIARLQRGQGACW